jgi:hypothetical protein
VDELAAAKCDPDMGGAARDGFEEHQIASLDVIGVDLAPDAVLLLDLAGERQPLLRKHPLHEAAAVEPGGVAAAVEVWRPSEREREGDHGGLNGDCC